MLWTVSNIWSRFKPVRFTTVPMVVHSKRLFRSTSRIKSGKLRVSGAVIEGGWRLISYFLHFGADLF
jgi:hypothetical protein